MWEKEFRNNGYTAFSTFVWIDGQEPRAKYRRCTRAN